MKALKINHLAVLVSIAMQFAIGFLWYGPFLFQNAWMDMVGLDMATLEANPQGVGVWIHSFASSIVSMYVLAWLFTKLNVTTWLKGAGYGFLIGFAFVLLSVKMSNAYAEFPYGLAWITGGFSTFGLTVGGAILGVWKKYKE